MKPKTVLPIKHSSVYNTYLVYIDVGGVGHEFLVEALAQVYLLNPDNPQLQDYIRAFISVQVIVSLDIIGMKQTKLYVLVSV
jgi:hypothetical protein